MPELPEVETVRRGLEPFLSGARIRRAETRRDGLRFPFPAGLAGRLADARIGGLRRRAKYILADLSTDEVLLIHLGMSGRMLVSGPESPPGATAMTGAFHHVHAAPGKHDHLLLDLDNGARVTLNDARRFGAVDLFPATQEAGHRLLRDLGPEPLGNAFDGDYLAARLKGRAQPVKAALLDQRLVAGLGNIYVCEVLHRAGIHPATRGGALSPGQAAGIVAIVREVLDEAIAAGGSSLRDYRQASGELGYFQHSFRVYDREGEPCPRPGCDGRVARLVQGGRSSFFCPACQPAGSAA